jgi:hypothetical protein
MRVFSLDVDSGGMVLGDRSNRTKPVCFMSPDPPSGFVRKPESYTRDLLPLGWVERVCDALIYRSISG